MGEAGVPLALYDVVPILCPNKEAMSVNYVGITCPAIIWEVLTVAWMLRMKAVRPVSKVSGAKAHPILNHT